MRKSDLSPGTKVRNIVSGKIGVARGKGNKLLDCASWCVMISRRITAGERKGQLTYPIWNVKNLVPA